MLLERTKAHTTLGLPAVAGFLLAFFGLNTASATEAKFDPLTCADLRIEQQKAIEAGLASDVARGPVWAKANLNQDRIHQIELFIAIDEHVKFGCRDAKITKDALAAAEAARRLELNPDADPLALPSIPGSDEDDPATESSEPDGARKRPATPDDVNKANAEKAKAEKKKAQTRSEDKGSRKPAPTAVTPKASSNDAYQPLSGFESVLKAPAAGYSAPP